MADAIAIAVEKREKMHAEINKLDEFIRMAETLLRSDGSSYQAGVTPVSPAPQAPKAAAPAETAPSAPAPVSEPAASAAETSEAESQAEESPMRMAARRLSNADVRRAPDAAGADGGDSARPSIIRRGFAG